MTPYASYPMPSELPPISNRRLRFFGVAAGLCVALGFLGPVLAEHQLSALARALHLEPLERLLSRSWVLLAWVCGFPAFCTSVALCLASFRRHCTKDAGYRLATTAFVTTVAAIGGWVLVPWLNTAGPEGLLIGLLVGSAISFIAALVGAFLALAPALVSVSPVVAALNRREAAAMRRAQRRYFDGREKQLHRRMDLAAHKPWRETSKGFHLTAAVCGGVCTAGLTAAALLITYSSFLGRGDSELGYALVVLLVWPALVVCIGAKVLGCGVTRTWKEGSMLAVFAYMWSVATFTMGALGFHMAESGRLALDNALMFGIACAFFGAIFSLIPCLIAIAGCAIFDNVRNCHANSTQRPQRGKLP